MISLLLVSGVLSVAAAPAPPVAMVLTVTGSVELARGTD